MRSGWVWGVGLVLYALFIFDVFIKALLSSVLAGSSYLALPFCAIYFLGSLTESSSLSWNDLKWALLMIIAIKLSLPLRLQSPSAETGPVLALATKEAGLQKSPAPWSQSDNRFP